MVKPKIQLNVRLSDEERNFCEEQANELGITISDFMRMLLKDYRVSVEKGNRYSVIYRDPELARAA